MYEVKDQMSHSQFNTFPIEPLLKRDEAARILGMSVSWVKKEIRAGRLRQTKLGKLVRIEPQELRDFIAAYRSGGVGDFVGTLSILGRFGPDPEKTEVVQKARG
jgi:excisionase family DNA binding protein